MPLAGCDKPPSLATPDSKILAHCPALVAPLAAVMLMGCLRMWVAVNDAEAVLAVEVDLLTCTARAVQEGGLALLKVRPGGWR